MSHKTPAPEKRKESSVFLIGLTGSIGAGKSTVAGLFREEGARVIHADLLAREALNSPSVRKAIEIEFGTDVFLSDGELNREQVASIVFCQPEKRKTLNRIIHPEVRRLYGEIRDSLPSGAILVYDVPLLFETGMEKDFDLLIVVSAEKGLRAQRVARRDGWTVEEFHRRENSQMDPVEKEKRADLVIRNEGDPGSLRTRIQEILEEIRNSLQEE